MSGKLNWSFDNTDAILATMHGKERVIAPLLQAALGLRIQVVAGLDTDRFGSFSRDIPRIGSPLDAARAKIAAAFELAPHAPIGVASEGSFGPYPQIPFIPFDSEIVLLLDRRIGLEIAGHYFTPRTNFSQTAVSNMGAAMAFAERVGFPAHGVIVMATAGGRPAPERLLRKNIETADDLKSMVGEAIALCGSAQLESDMRAHRNPTRLRAIKRATVDLIRHCRSACPQCNRPGFIVTERLFGLPCAGCGEPTDVMRAEVLACAGCTHRIERRIADALADPGRCDRCNP